MSDGNAIYLRKVNMIHNLEKFTKKLFSTLKNVELLELDKEEIKSFDLKVKINNKCYLIDVRYSLDFDTIKRKIYLEKNQKKLVEGLIPLIIVFSNKIRNIDYKELSKVAIILDISNILYIIRKNKYLLNELMGILDYSLDNFELKKPKLDLELTDDKNIKDSDINYIKLLESIAPGKTSYLEYQKCCIDILEYLFLDKLGLWNIQSVTDDGINIFDLICKIKTKFKSEFFTILEQYYYTKYIIFEFKNYKEEITQKEICITEKYLYKTALRNVAIIITRKGIDLNGEKMLKGILRENGKLIIVLNDDDLKKMIELKDKGEDPEMILNDKLDYILTHIEK